MAAFIMKFYLVTVFIVQCRGLYTRTRTPPTISPLGPVFPCPTVYLEPHPPTNRTVHQLRPQDIGIIGSLGDSITAGTGARASNIFEIIFEDRDWSFFTGSHGDSVLRMVERYNPEVEGASTGYTKMLQIPGTEEKDIEVEGLNVGVSLSVAEDLPEMVKELRSRIGNIPGWKEKWKMVSILIGHNDLCMKSCVTPLQSFGLERRVDVEPGDYERNIRTTLDLLKINLPNTLVVLLAPIQVSLTLDIVNKGFICKIAHKLECPCLFGPWSQDRSRVEKLWEQYVQILERISRESQYNTNEIAVVFQNTLVELKDGLESVNWDPVNLLSPDCFHFGSELHGMMARNLWNNLLQTQESRTAKFREGRKVEVVCPSRENPYFVTNGLGAAEGGGGKMET